MIRVERTSCDRDILLVNKKVLSNKIIIFCFLDGIAVKQISQKFTKLNQYVVKSIGF